MHGTRASIRRLNRQSPSRRAHAQLGRLPRGRRRPTSEPAMRSARLVSCCSGLLAPCALVVPLARGPGGLSASSQPRATPRAPPIGAPRRGLPQEGDSVGRRHQHSTGRSDGGFIRAPAFLRGVLGRSSCRDKNYWQQLGSPGGICRPPSSNGRRHRTLTSPSTTVPSVRVGHGQRRTREDPHREVTPHARLSLSSSRPSVSEPRAAIVVVVVGTDLIAKSNAGELEDHPARGLPRSKMDVGPRLEANFKSAPGARSKTPSPSRDPHAPRRGPAIGSAILESSRPLATSRARAGGGPPPRPSGVFSPWLRRCRAPRPFVSGETGEALVRRMCWACRPKQALAARPLKVATRLVARGELPAAATFLRSHARRIPPFGRGAALLRAGQIHRLMMPSRSFSVCGDAALSRRRRSGARRRFARATSPGPSRS